MDRIVNCIFLAAAGATFVWTWAAPAVSLGHFGTPLAHYTGLGLSMWATGALILVCLGLIRQVMGGARPGHRLGFVKDWVAYQRRTRFLNVLVPLVAFIVTMASFTVHKTVVLPGYGFTWDAEFIAWDRALFMGHDPWVLSHAVFDSAAATWWIDQLYHAWFYPMMIAYVLCGLMVAGPLVRACYIGTFLISWFGIGCVLAGLLASAGPIYDGALFEAGVFEPLKTRLAGQATELPGIASQFFQAELLAGHEVGKIGLGYGISAMPSMHVALAAMWALLFFGVSRWLGLVGVVYTVIIWVGSVHLGWHYAVDGMLSSALVVGIWGALRTTILRLASEKAVREGELQGIPGE
jgi:hypothetical protein